MLPFYPPWVTGFAFGVQFINEIFDSKKPKSDILWFQNGIEFLCQNCTLNEEVFRIISKISPKLFLKGEFLFFSDSESQRRPQNNRQMLIRVEQFEEPHRDIFSLDNIAKPIHHIIYEYNRWCRHIRPFLSHCLFIIISCCQN